MTQEKVEFKRSWRNYLIDPSFQLKYAFWISGTGIFLVAAMSALFYRYIHENYVTLVDLSPMTEETKLLMYSELNEILIKLGLISVTFIVIVSLLGIVLSHKAAGAVYHFRKIFRKVGDGETSLRIHLRPGDDFQEAAAEFNLMMDKLSARK
jgi:hypothetical protein